METEEVANAEDCLAIRSVSGSGANLSENDSAEVKRIPIYIVSQDGLHVTANEDKQSKVTNVSQKRVITKSFRFCRLIVGHPIAALGLTLSCHLLALFITGVLLVLRYDIFPLEFNQLPLSLRDSDDYLRGLAWMKRYQDKSILRRGSRCKVSTEERTQPIEALQLFYELAGGNVLTKAALTEMQRVEDKFYTNAVYQKSFCMMSTRQSNCVKPMSILRYFDGTYATLDPVFYDPDFANISGVISTADQHPETRRSLRHCLGTGAVINTDVAVVNITRTNLFLGLPLSGYTNDSDRAMEQTAKVKAFLKKMLMPLGDEYVAAGVGDMTFFYGNSITAVLTIKRTVRFDLRFVVGGYVFIFGYMWWQTSSLCLTSLVLLTTITGFCGANLIYRIVLGYRFFGIFHVLSIFIMLGISANDVFVFHDTWRFASFEPHTSLTNRLSMCYRMVAPAMFFASLTKTVAFSVSAASSLFAASTFGLFAALLVVVNYMSAITFLPCAIVFDHIHVQRCGCCCGLLANGTALVAKSRKFGIHLMVRIFSDHYFRLITHRLGRWVILAAFSVIVATATYSATLLQINDETPKLIPDHTNTGRYMMARRSAFEGRSIHDTVSVYMIWGLKKQDLSDCDPSDVDCTGKTVWNQMFDINSEDVQFALMYFCKRLKFLTDKEVTELHIRRDKATHVPEVNCFINVMTTFFRNERNRTTSGGRRVYPPGTTFALPFRENDAQTIMRSHSNIYQPDDEKRLLSGYVELMTSFWLNNGFRCEAPTNDFKQFNHLLGETPFSGFTKRINVVCPARDIKFAYPTRMKFIAITVNLTLWRTKFGYPTGLLIRDKWERFFKNEMQKMPPTLHGGFQVAIDGQANTKNMWHYYLVQQSVTRSALFGCIVGLTLALPIIVMATHNVYVGLLATLTLVFVTVSVVAVIPLAGWKLGVFQSVNLILVVALSVDYVMYLAQSYAHSPHSGRLKRTQHALEQGGISVLSGAVTTLGASTFMLFCDFVFFRQFGLILFATCSFSFIYAIGFFLTVLGMIGPEDNNGSIKNINIITFCRLTFFGNANKLPPPRPNKLVQRTTHSRLTSLSSVPTVQQMYLKRWSRIKVPTDNTGRWLTGASSTLKIADVHRIPELGVPSRNKMSRLSNPNIETR